DRSMNFDGAIDDVIARPFIYFGMGALLLMVPLALTSTNGMAKKLGAKRWSRLHQLIYVSAIAAVVHFYMSVKDDTTMALTFGVVLATLLTFRLAMHAAAQKKKPSERFDWMSAQERNPYR